LPKISERPGRKSVRAATNCSGRTDPHLPGLSAREYPEKVAADVNAFLG
jgi:hypothetical protein